MSHETSLMSGYESAEPFLDGEEIHVVHSQEEALIRAIKKWIQFQRGMWQHIVLRIDKPGRRAEWVGNLFRISIILLSALITTIADIDSIPRVWITILAGVLTAVTGIEGYFRFGEKRAELMRQQRELQTKRDDLRYEWAVHVELEPDLEKRLAAAKELLLRGPDDYNYILNKFVDQPKDEERPNPM